MATTTLAAATAATALTGCGGPISTSDDGRVTVAAGFYPLAWLAGRIAGPDAAVHNLTKPGAEPHDLELTPRQVIDISRADLVLVIKGVQPAVDEAVAQHAKGRTLDAADAVERLPADDGHAHGAADDHAGDGHAEDSGSEDSGAGDGRAGDGAAGRAGEPSAPARDARSDPHIWLDPSRFAAVAAAVRDRLAADDPAHAAAYRSRAGTLIAELERLDRDFRRGLARCARTTIVTGHASFGYLADRYRLEQVAISGLDPHAEPSPRRLADLTRIVREQGVTTVFMESNASAKVAKVLADTAGVTTATLDPVETVAPGSRDDYLSVMRGNLAALRTALDCR